MVWGLVKLHLSFCRHIMTHSKCIKHASWNWLKNVSKWFKMHEKDQCRTGFRCSRNPTLLSDMPGALPWSQGPAQDRRIPGGGGTWEGCELHGFGWAEGLRSGSDGHGSPRDQPGRLFGGDMRGGDVLMMSWWCDVMWCDVMWCDMMRCNDMMGWDEMQWYGARCMHSCELMRVWCYEMLTWWQGFCLHIPGESQHTWYLGGSSHDGLARTSSTTLSGRMWTSALLGNRVQIAGQGETSDAECASDVSSLSVDEQATCTARRHAAVQQGHLQEMEQKVDKSQPQLVKIWSLQQTRRVSSCFSKMFTFLLGIPVSQPLL